MIKTKDLVPEIYYKFSRDFQFLGRSLDVVFNYAKMNTDLLTGNPLSVNLDDSLVLLATRTIGFETKHQYNAQDLRNICSVFSSIIKDKGTETSIKRAVQTLMNSQNISGYYDVKIDNQYHTIKIYIPYGLKDLILLEDLLDYILPAGYDYRFIYGTSGGAMKDTLTVAEKINRYNIKDGLLGRILRPMLNDKRPDASDTNIETQGSANTFTGKSVGAEVGGEIEIEPYENEEEE